MVARIIECIPCTINRAIFHSLLDALSLSHPGTQLRRKFWQSPSCRGIRPALPFLGQNWSELRGSGNLDFGPKFQRLSELQCLCCN